MAKRIPYLRELGVTYLHLMPLLMPREGDSDGGYAVADYRRVRPDLGTIDDLRELTASLRADGVSLVLDLVLNHVAREHEWAEKARAGDERYRDYFHWFADRTMPDAYERTLPEVFPDFAPGNFTWDVDLQAWVWTTFNQWQWDVNWSNPDVFAEYAELVLFLANLGVEVLRLDAIAFVWKRLGTNSQNQPEVHAITQGLRAVARIAAPAVVFKAEAIVAPDDLVHYLGQGHHHGKVSDLAYHNSLMVQIWSALAAGDVRLAAHVLRNLPTAPTTTAWLTYVRCHDDIGWAITEEDASEVGLNGFEHRRFLSDYYAGDFFGSTARGLVFQSNPQTGDRRISGTTASLAGVEDALIRNDDDALDAAVARSLLAHAIVMGWGGVPVLWSGDELGLPNDPFWADEPAHAGDNRWAHRPRLPWKVAEQRAGIRNGPGPHVHRHRRAGRCPRALGPPGRIRSLGGADAVRPRRAAGAASTSGGQPVGALQPDRRLATVPGLAPGRIRPRCCPGCARRLSCESGLAEPGCPGPRRRREPVARAVPGNVAGRALSQDRSRISPVTEGL